MDTPPCSTARARRAGSETARLQSCPAPAAITPAEGSQWTREVHSFGEAQLGGVGEGERDSVGANVKARDSAGRFTFLGLTFKGLELADRPLLDPILREYPQPLTGFTFAALAAWNSSFHYAFHLDERHSRLVLSFDNPRTGERHLLQPIGRISDGATAALLEASRALPYPLRIVGVSPPFLEAHPRIARDFSCEESRESANYVYRTEDLATLAGKRFSKKRNLIAQARRLYEWQVAPLDASSADACRALVQEIVGEDAPTIDASLEREMAALDFTLRNFQALGQRGTIARIGGELAAFAIWEPVGEGMAIVHFERALRRFKGLYQVINQETARCIQALGLPLINREEDLGEPGLRQAKLSYQPLRLQPSLSLTLRPVAGESLPY